MVGALGENPDIIDERMQRAVEKPFRLGDKALEVDKLGEVGGDVAGPVRVTLAFRRHGVARASDDPPAGVAKALDKVIPSLFGLRPKFLPLECTISNTVNSIFEKNRQTIEQKRVIGDR